MSFPGGIQSLPNYLLCILRSRAEVEQYGGARNGSCCGSSLVERDHENLKTL